MLKSIFSINRFNQSYFIIKILGSLIEPFNIKVFASNTSFWCNFIVAIACRGLINYRNVYIINLHINLLFLPDN